jgi:acetoin utilization deacetylase AcuC-like enzyme
VHDRSYIARVSEGRLTAAEQRSIGFPWSPALAERARRSVGATIAACRAAAEGGVAASLAGGTHHAQRAGGAGYCVYNDVAVAARVIQSEVRQRHALRVAIVDLDVHQGDGTAQIFAGDESVFTLSIHAQSNYPAHKQASDLDIGLPDGTGDAEYLAALDRALVGLASFAPERILYVSGADPHLDDRLGRLCLTAEGLANARPARLRLRRTVRRAGGCHDGRRLRTRSGGDRRHSSADTAACVQRFEAVSHDARRACMNRSLRARRGSGGRRCRSSSW